MHQLRVNDQIISVTSGANLLDALIDAGEPVAWSCRAGSCQACLIKAVEGDVPPSAQHYLAPDQQQAGWLLACQCAVRSDMTLQLHDPTRDALAARVVDTAQLNSHTLRLRIKPQGPFRFTPGQHATLWLNPQLGRPFSIASQSDDPWLEFHLRLSPDGEFTVPAAQLRAGDVLHIGAASGHLHFDPAWADRPLLMLSRGTGLAPISAITRDALQRTHTAPITLWHWSSEGCYLADELLELAAHYPQLRLHLRSTEELANDLTRLGALHRRTLALLCGSPGFIELLPKPLFLAGLPGRQVLTEAFFNPHNLSL